MLTVSSLLITRSIKEEVLAIKSNDALLIQAVIDEGWLKCVDDPKLETVVSRSLGLGEKTAIKHALQSKEDVLLVMNDFLARKKALRYQLNIVGTDIIYTAENKQLIINTDELIEELRII